MPDGNQIFKPIVVLTRAAYYHPNNALLLKAVSTDIIFVIIQIYCLLVVWPGVLMLQFARLMRTRLNNGLRFCMVELCLDLLRLTWTWLWVCGLDFLRRKWCRFIPLEVYGRKYSMPLAVSMRIMGIHFSNASWFSCVYLKGGFVLPICYNKIHVYIISRCWNISQSKFILVTRGLIKTCPYPCYVKLQPRTSSGSLWLLICVYSM